MSGLLGIGLVIGFLLIVVAFVWWAVNEPFDDGGDDPMGGSR
jgi:nitrogen fixation-related uncharacterized protein